MPGPTLLLPDGQAQTGFTYVENPNNKTQPKLPPLEGKEEDVFAQPTGYTVNFMPVLQYHAEHSLMMRALETREGDALILACPVGARIGL